MLDYANGANAITPSGVLAFSDPDTADRPTASIDTAHQTVTYQDFAGRSYSLTPAQITALEAAFSIAPETGNTNSGKVDWSYSIVDKSLDFLGQGEKVTVTTPIVIDDHNGGTVTQNIVTTINGADDLPLAVPDVAVVQKGKTVTVDAAYGVLANDTDPDIHDTLHVSKVNGLDFNVGQPISGTYGTLTLNADGSYSYLANPNLGKAASQGSGQDQFSYMIDDGHGGTASSQLDVTISLRASTPVGGSLANDLSIAAAEIAAEIQNGISPSVAFHLRDDPLVARIAADTATQFNSTTNYTINPQGFINPIGVSTKFNINPDLDQCVALVLGLDNSVPLQTKNWTNGAEQIELNGGSNPNISPGAAIPIATFVNTAGQEASYLSPETGHYPTNAEQHAAIFLGYGTEAGLPGFFMLDQYVHQPTLNPASQPAEVRFHPFNDAADEYYNIVPVPAPAPNSVAQSTSLLVQTIAAFDASSSGNISLAPSQPQGPDHTLLVANTHG